MLITLLAVPRDLASNLIICSVPLSHSIFVIQTNLDFKVMVNFLLIFFSQLRI